MIQPAQLREIILKSGFVKSEDFDAAVKTSEELDKEITDIIVICNILFDSFRIFDGGIIVPFDRIYSKS